VIHSRSESYVAQGSANVNGTADAATTSATVTPGATSQLQAAVTDDVHHGKIGDDAVDDASTRQGQ
jgi:hypothetical protein